MPMFFDPVMMLILVVGGFLSLWASMRVKSAFARWSQVPSRRGLTAAQAARIMLDEAGIRDVEIVPTQGMLSDHYDPANKRLALSEPVYNSRSVAALGIACHEAGHAIQYATGYAGITITSMLFKPAAIGSQLGLFALVIGLGLQAAGTVLGAPIATLGIVLFGATFAFQVFTLPVEFDASRRAKAEIVNAGIITLDEREGVDAVLNAAALTYVATAVTVALQFAYSLFLFLGSQRD